MIKQIIFLIMIFILSMSSTALAAEGNGKLEGYLVNGTANASSMDNEEIRLKVYKNGAETSSDTTTITGNEGRFVFEGLATAAEYSYEVTLFYQTVEYFSDAVRFNQNEKSASVNVTVWEATGDVEVLEVDTAHTIIYTGQGALRITEYYSFANDSDKTYIGFKVVGDDDTKETLRFTLPANVSEFQPTLGLMDCCIYGSEEGFIDTMAVMPGEKEVSFTYTLPVDSDEMVIPQNLYYPTASYELMVQGGEVGVDVNLLTAMESVFIEGAEYSRFSGSDLTPGKALVIRLSGLPQVEGKDAVWWMILSLVGLGSGFGLYYFKRLKKMQPVRVEDSSEARQEELLAKLVRLDDDFELGNMNESVYQRQRDDIKAQLRGLMEKNS